MASPPNIDRRRFIRGLACATGAMAAGAPVFLSGRAATAGIELAAAYPTILRFDVTRDGAPLGVVMERFGRDGDDAITEVFIDFKVTFAGFVLYRYEHRSRERWRDRRLAALDTVTNDNGTPQAVQARARAGGLRVDGVEGRITAPSDILPSSYWHPRFVEQRRMLDSQRGRIREFTITPAGDETVVALGRPIACTRFAMRGDIDLDFWYDARRVWQKMRFTIKGSDIEYTRVVPDPADTLRFGAPLYDGRPSPAA